MHIIKVEVIEILWNVCAKTPQLVQKSGIDILPRMGLFTREVHEEISILSPFAAVVSCN